jgi:branched-chain amino acid transport system permease protein
MSIATVAALSESRQPRWLIKPAAVLAGVALVALVVPAVAGAAWLTTLTSATIFAVAAGGTGLLYSRLGLASLAQVALMGVGAWAMLRMHFATDLPFVACVVVAGAVTAVVAVVLALPALRLRGLYLALVTLMIAAGFDIAFNAAGFPNGGSGFLGYQDSGELQRLARPAFAVTDEGYFRFVVVVAALLLVVACVHLATRPGRSWALIKRSDVAATSCGVPLTTMKTWAFALAGLLSGVAGALLAGQLGLVAPSTFPVTDSLLLFGLVVVAGAHHWAGWVVAAVLYKVVPFGLNELGVDGSVATIIFGVALMASLLGSDGGIVGDVQAKLGGLRRKNEVAA